MTEYIRIVEGKKVHIFKEKFWHWTWCGLFGMRKGLAEVPPSPDLICKRCLRLSELHKVNK